MIITARRKGKYKVGTLELTKVNAENLIVLKKCKAFLESYGWNKDEVFDFSAFEGEDSPEAMKWFMCGRGFDLVVEKAIDVHFDYYKREITFYGRNHCSNSKVNVNEAVLSGVTAFNAFLIISNWFLPVREVENSITTSGEYNEMNPLSGTITGLTHKAFKVSESLGDLTSVTLIRKVDSDTGEISYEHIDLSRVGERFTASIGTSSSDLIEYLRVTPEGIEYSSGKMIHTIVLK